MAAVANGVKGERRAVASGYAAGHEANVWVCRGHFAVVKITHAIQYNVTCAYIIQRWGWASTGWHTMSSSIEANCFCCSVSVNLQSFFRRAHCLQIQMHAQIRIQRLQIHRYKKGRTRIQTLPRKWQTFPNSLGKDSSQIWATHIFAHSHLPLAAICTSPLIAANIQIFAVWLQTNELGTVRDCDWGPCWRNG